MSAVAALRPDLAGPDQKAIRFWNLVVPRAQATTDLLAGVTTFLVMSYIIFVNPGILGFVGVKGLAGKDLPFAAVMTALFVIYFLQAFLHAQFGA